MLGRCLLFEIEEGLRYKVSFYHLRTNKCDISIEGIKQEVRKELENIYSLEKIKSFSFNQKGHTLYCTLCVVSEQCFIGNKGVDLLLTNTNVIVFGVFVGRNFSKKLGRVNSYRDCVNNIQDYHHTDVKRLLEENIHLV